MMLNSGVHHQVFARPKAEQVFRPWWDFVEDCVLSSMLAIGKRYSRGLLRTEMMWMFKCQYLELGIYCYSKSCTVSLIYR